MVPPFTNILQYFGPFGPLSGITVQAYGSYSGINNIYQYKYRSVMLVPTDGNVSEN